jgi:hypothetical protein
MKGQASMALLLVIALIVVVVVVLLLVFLLGGQTPQNLSWSPSLPWFGGVSNYQGYSGYDPGDFDISQWCISGQTYQTEAGILTNMGPTYYMGQMLCRLRFDGDTGTAYFYTNHDGSVWYLTDEYGNLDDYYMNYLNGVDDDAGDPGNSGWSGGSCVPGNPCSTDKTYDCGCTCFDAVYVNNIVGDGWCDESSVDLNCAEFTWDSGDCEDYWCLPGDTINVYALLVPDSTAIAEQMTTYDGYHLCQATLSDDTIYLGGKNGRVWYVFDSQGHIISSSSASSIFDNGVDSGCADGTREAFVDQTAYPGIAGCSGSWTNPDLRASGSDTADSLCASGWHICMKGGGPLELPNYGVTASACESAGDGMFLAASSHCTAYPSCSTTYPLDCKESGYCSEPICCGSDCGFGSCKDAIWEGETRINVGTSHGCANSPSSTSGATGVLCCRISQ